MGRPIVLFSLCFFIAFVSAKAVCLNRLDTLKAYKLSKKEFLEKYGTDDTLKALIDVYFDNRTRSIFCIAASPASIVLAGGVIVYDINSFNGPGDVYFPVKGILAGLVLSSAGQIISIVGIVDFIKFSRKNLYNQIQAYKEGNPLPIAMQKRVNRRLKHQI